MGRCNYWMAVCLLVLMSLVASANRPQVASGPQPGTFGHKTNTHLEKLGFTNIRARGEERVVRVKRGAALLIPVTATTRSKLNGQKVDVPLLVVHPLPSDGSHFTFKVSQDEARSAAIRLKLLGDIHIVGE